MPHEPVSEPFALAPLIDYAENAIVSRTLVDKHAGTVTLFAFWAGQGLSEHTAPYDAIVQVVDGEGEFIISGTPHTVQAGEMIIMPARQPHAVQTTQNMKMLLIMIKEEENR